MGLKRRSYATAGRPSRKERTVRVLVTGGAGYIGSITATELLDAGHEVAVLDNLYQGHRDAVPSQARFYEGDLADRPFLARCFAELAPVDAVMHFASYTLVSESMQLPFKYLRDNVANAANLLEAATQAGTSRFILSSTANLFDAPERIPIAETERIVPGSPYGESKQTIERILHWLHVTRGLRYAALRYFNAAGCTAGQGEDHHPETHLIPLVLQVALGQRPSITVFGHDYPTRDGTCVRDYIHVVDLARAHILALEALDGLGWRTYNLGNGQGYTVLEVIEAARKITGHPIPHTVGERRPGDPATLVASSDAIRRELGWRPAMPTIEAIVASAWDWHQRHPEGYPR
jgi:UDP-glucose 4-epimerase